MAAVTMVVLTELLLYVTFLLDKRLSRQEGAGCYILCPPDLMLCFPTRMNLRMGKVPGNTAFITTSSCPHKDGDINSIIEPGSKIGLPRIMTGRDIQEGFLKGVASTEPAGWQGRIWLAI